MLMAASADDDTHFREFCKPTWPLLRGTKANCLSCDGSGSGLAVRRYAALLPSESYRRDDVLLRMSSPIVRQS